MWSLKHKWPEPSGALDGLTFYGLLAHLPFAQIFPVYFHIYAKLAVVLYK